MRLLVLGCGSAFSDTGHNAGYALDGRLLVDCGAPAHMLLPRAGLAVDDVEAVLLTHFHADHTFMLPLLLGARGLSRASPAPLHLAGPPGTREYVLRLLLTGYGRHLHDLILERLGLECTTLQDGSDERVAGYRVRANAVVHSTGPSLSYAVSDHDGATVGFSGDSSLCAGLRRTVALSHLMVCECTGWDGPVPSHLWREEVERLMAENPDSRFLVSHLQERRTFPGALVAHDLLAVDVEAPPRVVPEPPASLRAAVVES
ncbi:MAG: MBL fold metallo-hydrolase [Chloroflexi bacterium]|nr:MAG: MBL fold metallo-hydrolase [Chloroflexota bacterium]